MFDMPIDDLVLMIKGFQTDMSSNDAEIGYLENAKAVAEARVMDLDMETWYR